MCGLSAAVFTLDFILAFLPTDIIAKFKRAVVKIAQGQICTAVLSLYHWDCVCLT